MIERARPKGKTAPDPAPSPTPKPLKLRLLEWHKQIAWVTGGMALTYGHTGLNRHDVAQWAEILIRVGNELKALIGKPNE